MHDKESLMGDVLMNVLWVLLWVCAIGVFICSTALLFVS